MLNLNLSGKLVLVAGVADDQGFGWAICKALKQAGARIIVGAWPPAITILEKSLARGKFDTKLANNEELSFEKIYPLDAMYDELDQVPSDIAESKRYKDIGDYSIDGLVKAIEADFGKGTLFAAVHSLANGPEVKNDLSKTSREGYLAASSASAYSYISFVSRLSPIMSRGGSFLALSYLASEKVVPGYGGGMSSAKAALESDTRVLAYEIGREYAHRVNVISAGPLASRAAKSIGIISDMITFCKENAPIQEELLPEDVGHTAAFLCSDLARGITASTVYVDKGIHAMAAAPQK